MKHLLLFTIAFLWSIHSAAETSIYQQLNQPQSKLTFQYAPDLIIKQAKEKRYLKVKTGNKALPYTTFLQLKAKQMKEKKAGIYIGIVVDEDTKPVQQLASQVYQLLAGDQKAGAAGLAQKYGGRVIGVVPIKYEANQKNNKEQPIEKGQILVAINDYAIGKDKQGRFFNNWQQVKDYLIYSFEDGAHLVSRIEYLEHKDAERAKQELAKQELAKQQLELAKLEKELEKINQQIRDNIVIELLLKRYTEGLSDAQLNELAIIIDTNEKTYKLSDGSLNHPVIYELVQKKYY